MSSFEREWFARVLIDSNRQILQAHLKGVHHVLYLLSLLANTTTLSN